MGAYHTIELELNRKFTLAKKSWDSIVLDRIGKQVPLCIVYWDFNVLYSDIQNNYSWKFHLVSFLCLAHSSSHFPHARQPGLVNTNQIDSQVSCLPDRISWALATAVSAARSHSPFPYTRKIACNFLYLLTHTQEMTSSSLEYSHLMSTQMGNNIFLFRPNEPNHRNKFKDGAYKS